MRDASAPRILIVKLSAVGDVVHALPALNALRNAMPNAHIGWAVHAGPANLLEGQPQIDELIIVPRGFRRENRHMGLGEIRTLLRGSGGWDVAIDLQGLAKSGIAALLSGAPRRIGFAGAASREFNRFFVNERIRSEAESVIQMNLDLLAPLIGPVQEKRALLHTAPEDERKIEQWERESGVGESKFLLLDPFAGWESKRWPCEKWIETAREANARFGLRPLVFFGPGERDEARDLCEAMRSGGSDPLLAPETTLREYVVLATRKAAAMVGGDTGPMHLAAAAGVPVVAIFGPSDSRRNAPEFTGARFEVLQDFRQPCAGTFARRCRHHPPGGCMETISPAMVLESLGRLLSAGSTESAQR